MAQAVGMRSHRAFKSGGSAPRSRSTVVVRAAHVSDQPSLRQRIAPSLLAAMMTLSTGLATMDAVYAPAARADEVEELTPYQKRQMELEKRREILREAREKAAARAAGTAVEAAPEAEREKPAADIAGQAARLKSSAAKAYEDAAKKSFTAPAPAPEPSSSFSFPTPPDPWRRPAAPSPAAPAPVVPAPAPAAPQVVAKPTPAPAPVNAPVKAELDTYGKKPGKPGKPHKRRGPLPLWLTEVLLLGAYGALGLAVTKYSKESSAAVKVAGSKVIEAYNALEKLVAQQKQKKSSS